MLQSKEPSPVPAHPPHTASSAPAEILGKTHDGSSGFNPWSGAGCSAGGGRRQATTTLPRKAATLHVLQRCPSPDPSAGAPDWKGQVVLDASGRFRANNPAGRTHAARVMHRAASAGSGSCWDPAGKARPPQALHLTGALTLSPTEGLAPVPSRGARPAPVSEIKRRKREKPE